METSLKQGSWKWRRRVIPAFGVILVFLTFNWRPNAHIVPPEQFHPVAESYRRMTFLLNLNPVLWDQVNQDAEVIMEELDRVDSQEAEEYRERIDTLIDELTQEDGTVEDPPGPAERIAGSLLRQQWPHGQGTPGR